MAAVAVGVVKEADPAERRVALVPEVVPKLTGLGLDVLVEHDAGTGAWLADSAYTEAGASAVSGVVSAGLRTIVLPQASAGAIFHASIKMGKFHGMTCAATPSGRGLGP